MTEAVAIPTCDLPVGSGALLSTGSIEVHGCDCPAYVVTPTVSFGGLRYLAYVVFEDGLRYTYSYGTSEDEAMLSLLAYVDRRSP